MQNMTTTEVLKPISELLYDKLWQFIITHVDAMKMYNDSLLTDYGRNSENTVYGVSILHYKTTAPRRVAIVYNLEKKHLQVYLLKSTEEPNKYTESLDEIVNSYINSKSLHPKYFMNRIRYKGLPTVSKLFEDATKMSTVMPWCNYIDTTTEVTALLNAVENGIASNIKSTVVSYCATCTAPSCENCLDNKES